MNLNQIISRLTRMVLHRAANRGVNKTIDRLAKSGGKSAKLSPTQARDLRAGVKRARQAAKLARRLGR